MQIGFSTTNKIISRIIRWFTKAKCSHTFFVFALFDRPWVLGAEFGGIELISLERFQKNNSIVALADVPELGEEAVKDAMASLGEAYDFGGLLGGIFPIIGRWLKLKWTNPWENPKAMYCSEFVIRTLKAHKFPDIEALDATTATPQDLHDFLVAHYAKE